MRVAAAVFLFAFQAALSGCAVHRPLKPQFPADRKATCSVEAVDAQGQYTILHCLWGDGHADTWRRY